MAEKNKGLQIDDLQFRHKPTKSFGRFRENLSVYNIDVPEENIGIVLNDPQCRAFITNDGSASFAVHSTSTERAIQILHDGLVYSGRRDIGKGLDKEKNPSIPHFGGTVVLLAGPKERDQTRINAHAMAYEFKGNPAKVVFAFPVPNLHKSDYVGEGVDNSFLGKFDGEFVQHIVDDENVINDSFLLNPAYAYGYFDLGTQQFMVNEQFKGFEINKPQTTKSWLRRKLI